MPIRILGQHLDAKHRSNFLNPQHQQKKQVAQGPIRATNLERVIPEAEKQNESTEVFVNRSVEHVDNNSIKSLPVLQHNFRQAMNNLNHTCAGLMLVHMAPHYPSLIGLPGLYYQPGSNKEPIPVNSTGSNLPGHGLVRLRQYGHEFIVATEIALDALYSKMAMAQYQLQKLVHEFALFGVQSNMSQSQLLPLLPIVTQLQPIALKPFPGIHEKIGVPVTPWLPDHFNASFSAAAIQKPIPFTMYWKLGVSVAPTMPAARGFYFIPEAPRKNMVFQNPFSPYSAWEKWCSNIQNKSLPILYPTLDYNDETIRKKDSHVMPTVQKDKGEQITIAEQCGKTAETSVVKSNALLEHGRQLLKTVETRGDKLEGKKNKAFNKDILSKNKVMQEDKSIQLTAGFPNDGNMCFANASLKAMLAAYPKAFFLGLREKMNDVDVNRKPVFEAFLSLFDALDNQEKEKEKEKINNALHDFYKAYQEYRDKQQGEDGYDKNFFDGEQHDAQEFILSLMEVLGISENPLFSLKINTIVTVKSEKELEFSYQLSDRETKQPFLFIHPEKNQEKMLPEIVNNMVQPFPVEFEFTLGNQELNFIKGNKDELEKILVSRNDKQSDKNKPLSITHKKIFVADTKKLSHIGFHVVPSYSNENNNPIIKLAEESKALLDKNNDYIKLPIFDKESGKEELLKFKRKSICVHNGSCLNYNGGHYIAAIKSRDKREGFWQCHDDNVVNDIEEGSLKAQGKPYLMFYERIWDE
ncbi:MAG: hypothetical protein PUP46_10670 [Endozoicomonas sp. (ex Botrylloides leachii)]|nr:hypothetical protein [Endozoicomonas sp. (ex Botrylloides leachii)]